MSSPDPSDPPDASSLVLQLSERLKRAEPRPQRGRIRRIRGLMVHATLTTVGIGELCYLRDPLTNRFVAAEVVGFEAEEAVLTPIGDLRGMSAQAEVIPTGEQLSTPVGDLLLGRVIDPLGQFMDGMEQGAQSLQQLPRYPLHASPPPPMTRQLIDQPLALGVRAIDGLITVARGQRIGIFGEPGAGKSMLLASIIRGTEADVVVLALVGERGREVRELLDVHLGAALRARTVAVVATSDRPAIERTKAALMATSVAEYFRDQGKDVLLLMDSITRFARAQREIGLAAGEPPTRRGYPPSLFAALPRLLERSGPAAHGTITGIYTVLTEGDESLDPVAEETRAILDGHIMLSGDLARRNHFPAIDVLASRSRLMATVGSQAHNDTAASIRDSMARYLDVELLLQVGEYVYGQDPVTDAAIDQHEEIESFLRQAASESCEFDETLAKMRGILD